MKKLGDILNLQNISDEIVKQDKKENLLVNAWEAAMGSDCSSHTKKIVLNNGILSIIVDSQVWRQELLLTGKEFIIEKMKQEINKNIIDIKIKAGG